MSNDERRRQADAILQAAGGSQIPNMLFVIGSGDGSLLDAIEAANPAAAVVLLDPDPLAMQRLLAGRDWTTWIGSGRLTLLSGPEYSGASGSWRPAAVPAQDPPILVDPETAAGDPRGVANAEAIVARIVSEARANAEARRTHAGRYLLHTLSNAPRIAREGNVASLFDAFPGVPAIIVGAGPSLDGMVSAIAACKDRALIVACDAAARPLMAAGVTPHFIIAVDPAESHAMHLAALHNPRAAWLIAEASVHPHGLAPFEGRTFFFNLGEHDPWPWLGSIGFGRGRLAAWGSVATTALDFVLRLGCDRVVFAGLDFAFTNGRAYCRGTTFEAQWATWMAAGETFDAISRMLVNRWPAVVEPDADGRMVRTAPHFVAFRNWMRERMDGTPSVRFINATPGGIFHGGRLEHMTFEDALQEGQSIDSRQFDQRVRALHAISRHESQRLFEAVHRLLAATIGDAPKNATDASAVDDWLAFGAGTVRPEMIVAALRSREYQAWEMGARSAATLTHVAADAEGDEDTSLREPGSSRRKTVAPLATLPQPRRSY